MTSTKEFVTLSQALLALSDAVIEMRATLAELVREGKNEEALKHLEESGKGVRQSLARLQEFVNLVKEDID